MTGVIDSTTALLALLGQARAASLLLAQSTGVVDWTECAGWCVRAARFAGGDEGAVSVLGAQCDVVDYVDASKLVCASLSLARELLPCPEIESAQRAADDAQGAAR